MVADSSPLAYRSTAMTCSEDGTIRLWDTNEVSQKTVIKPQLQKPGRICVSACAYNNVGSSIAAGMVDGSIHIWDAKGLLRHAQRGLSEKFGKVCLH